MSGQPAGRRSRWSRREAIVQGASFGVVGIPCGFLILQTAHVGITNSLLVACVAAPTIILLCAALVKPWRARAWPAALASAAASVAMVLVVFGGITLISTMLSDPA